MRVIGVNNTTSLPSVRYLKRSDDPKAVLARYNEYPATVLELELFVLFAEASAQIQNNLSEIKKELKEQLRFSKSQKKKYSIDDEEDD